MGQTGSGSTSKKNWKGVDTTDSAKRRVDEGILVQWKEMRTLKRNFKEPQQIEIIKHMTKRLCERAEERLSAEILIETLMIWLSNSVSVDIVDAFLDTMFEEPGLEEATRALVEIALTTEVTDNQNDEQIFSTSVALICELGKAIHDFELQNPRKFSSGRELLDHIATYLLSVSNRNNPRIRLTLLHYFGLTALDTGKTQSFNRVMGRFGHTTLDHLFALLFIKRSEAVAFRFLLDNLPSVFIADTHSQKILHESLKYHMFKHPEPFATFVRALVDHVLKDSYLKERTEVHQVLLQHLGALVNVVSEVNHKPLAKEILLNICKFEDHPYRDIILDQIAAQPAVRPLFKDIVRQFRAAKSYQEVEGVASKLGTSKRGRRPTFGRAGDIGTIDQISFLGSASLAAAS